MTKENGRYSRADVKGHTFIARKYTMPNEVYVVDLQYGTLYPTPEQLADNPWAPVIRNMFVIFTYEWDGQQQQMSLQWHRFLTLYKRKDW